MSLPVKFNETNEDCYYKFKSKNDALKFYFENAYSDIPFFLHALSAHNFIIYTYFGDVEKNIFYISDNMRDDLYYQVINKFDQIFWVCCCGVLKWNKDTAKPVFFAGFIVKQSDEFVDKILSYKLGNTMMLYRLHGVRFFAIADENIDVKNVINVMRNIIDSEYDWFGLSVDKSCNFVAIKFPQNNKFATSFDKDLIFFIPLQLKKYNLDGKYIFIEKTESCMDNDSVKLIRIYRELGIKVALDDFGTGYSSLSVLMKYPIDIIKIDRSLLLETAETVNNITFFISLIKSGQHFGKKICVEGVESVEQKKLLKKTM